MTDLSGVSTVRGRSNSYDLEIGSLHEDRSPRFDRDEIDIESGLRHSSGGHRDAMNPSGRPGIVLGEHDRMFGERPTYGSVDNRSNRVESVESGRIVRIEQDQDETRLEIEDGSSIEGSGGPGGCCSCWDRTAQMLKAGIVQALSTAVTFGTKPLVEAALLNALGVTALTASTPALPLIVSGVAGGLYVGLIHTVASKIVGGIMNAALQVDTYAPKPGSNELLGEMLTIDMPVMGAFVGGYALRGTVMDGNTSVWLDALSKTITSTSAGFVQGIVTDGLRQAYETVYQSKGPVRVEDGAKFDFFVKTATEAITKQFETGKAFGHDFLGKIAGSGMGMAYTQLLRDVDLGSAGKGALGMTTYLSSWFTGIHVAAEVMRRMVDGGDAPPQTNQPPPTGHVTDPSDMV